MKRLHRTESPDAAMQKLPTQPAREVTAVVPHQSATARRLRLLERKESQLVHQITKRKTAISQAEQRRAEAQDLVNTKLSPLLARQKQLQCELRQLLSDCLEQVNKLSRKEQAQMRRRYAPTLAELRAKTEQPPVGKSSSPKSHRKASQSANSSAGEHDSAKKNSLTNTGAIKTTFRRLAIELHPDREASPSKRGELTELLKTITLAYDAGDLAKLLEIEAQWLAPFNGVPSPDSTAQRMTQQNNKNRELRLQLRTLTAELKTLKAAAPATLDALSSLDQEVRVLGDQVDFVQAYWNGTVSNEHFLTGDNS